MSRVLLLLVLLSFSFLPLSYGQNRQLTGVVKDKSDGTALVGVSVTLKDSKAGTSTDANGVYKISVPQKGSILVFNYMGYKTKTVIVGDQNKVDVTLEEDVNTLQEVTVNVGYGVVKKKDLTGAVSSVSSEVIAAAPVSSALEAIQGRVAGISIASTEGSPDADLTVRIRGGGSITGDNSPLYIVDGFPVASIADIAPQDIESIDILKDASSTAIYGSRGANGVVLVSTKNSKTGKTAIAYNVFTGVRNLANKLGLLSPSDYVRWQYERSLLDNSPNDYTQYFGNYQDIDLYNNVPANDWQEIIFGRTGTTFNQNINISGGGDKTKYSLSHTFVKDKAIMQLSGFERQNINFKINHKLYDKLTLDFGLRYANTKIKGGGANEQNEVSSADSRLKNAMLYPSFPVPGLTTTTETDDEFNLYNPMIAISDNDQYIQRKTYNINGAINYDIIDNLRFRSEVGYDGFRNDQDRFYGTTTYYVRNVPSAENQNLPAIILANTNRNSFRNANTLNYSFGKILGKNHNLNALVGQEFIKTENGILTSVVHGFPKSFGFQDARVLSTQGKANSIDNNFSPDDKLLSFFARANYDYQGKYLFSAAFRADGSSKFSPENQWGYFPAFSAAWRISQEKFMSGTKSWITDLKIRASYGSVGNNNIPPGQMNQTFQNSVTTWVNGFNNYWAASKTMANPDLKWETTVTNNLGIDFTLFNSKLNGTIDLYRNRTKDLLLQFPVAGTGYDFQYRNIGETQNKGIEFSLNWTAIKKTNFDLSFSGNINFNRNKVVSLGSIKNINGSSGWASTEIGVDYLVEEGAPLGRIYGYRNAGRYEVSDFTGYNATTGNWTLKPGVVDGTSFLGTIRPGTMKIQDLSGDGKIDLSDRTVIGNANPLHTGGFSVNSRIYGFDIGAYFNWSFGNDIYNANKIEYTSTSKYSSRNMIDIMTSGNRWNNLRADGTISNDPTELAAMNAGTTLWSPYMKTFVLSDWAVEDGSFLRLSTITLGYTLPDKIASKLKMKKLRIYASGYNLWLLTDYTGFDPEVSTRRRTNLTPGVDYSAYPKSKSFVFGLNVNF
ncbi:SusC/RagA family TonB-linked outer membrane protein [Pedobacter rhizosphaerae]|uniref:TonB-linked outer membrane protein, SusC/RagA family n=1 Tax=Pedobacter rhizosphaerae TaxID=390241 RepID=A0A1H9TAS8_9SPHI|nr:TonB-dependent receptor [Pedobacter rhizosphaerae]SER94238.1 TonB-linked outer membrane protein, SusC/RagA family [Pedobacter rhizosphaerae]